MFRTNYLGLGERMELLRKTVSGIMLTLLFIGMLTLASNTQGVEAPSGSSSIVGGYISQNTTWTLDGSPYIVVEDVVVEPGVTLTIEAGVIVKFTSGTNLVIDGALVAKGNTTHPITFTSNSTDPAPGDWGSICFRDSSIDSLCEISCSILEYGTNAILAEFSSPRILYCNITNNAENGISISEGTPIISKCYISANQRGIYCGGARASPTIIDNVIMNNTFEGVFCSWVWSWSGLTSISANTISFNGADGIRCEVSHQIIISNNTLINNSGAGIFCDREDNEIRMNRVSGNQYGIYGTPSIVTFNHIRGNAFYDFYKIGGTDINATYNWWGTTNETAIKEHIYDYYDDYNLGRVLYKPYLVPPVANFTFSPETLYACGTLTFDASASFNPYGSIIKYTWDFGDGNTTTTMSPIVNHTYSVPGTYNVTLTVTDEFGLTNSTVTSLIVLRDDVPPITSDDYDGTWRNSDFTITLTAIDDESRVAETYYRINGGPVKTVSVDGHPYITSEGANNTLEYWSIDNAGNEELPHKILTGIKLDKTSPIIVISSQLPESDIQPQQEVRVLVNVTDFVSEVKNATLSYNLNYSLIWIDLPMTFNTTTGLYESTIPGQPAGTVVKYRIVAYDNAGNYEVEDNSGQYYVYTVIPEFPSIMFPLISIMLLTVFIIALKKSRRYYS